MQEEEAGDGDGAVYRVHAAGGGHSGGLDPHQEVPGVPEKAGPMTPVDEAGGGGGGTDYISSYLPVCLWHPPHLLISK